MSVWDDEIDEDIEDFEELEDIGDEDLDAFDPEADEALTDLGDAFREALHEDYAGLSPEETDAALLEIFESLPPAESFNLGKALNLVQKGAAGALDDPALRQIAGAALPVVGGAVGTAIVPGVGTAFGSSLGTVAGKALGGQAGARPPQAAAGAAAAAIPTPLAGTGRPPGAAATQALLATALPVVPKALLASALGPHGARTVDGIPVPLLMSWLGSMFTRAAEEADELAYRSGQLAAEPLDAESVDGGPADRDQALYESLLDAEEQDLADAMGV